MDRPIDRRMDHPIDRPADRSALVEHASACWELPAQGAMKVPVRVFASKALLNAMDDQALQQAVNVATLPGIVGASCVMPDAHWGYGFPIGGVAAFDARSGGVVSAGGVGFDISCGVRCLRTGLKRADVMAVQPVLADALFAHIPAGLGSTGPIRLNASRLHDMLVGGGRWAVEQGWGEAADLERCEEGGRMLHAKPGAVSDLARKRQRDEMGTLGSGNHYLEVQEVSQIFHAAIAEAWGVNEGDVMVMLHCGSRGLGHQIGADYLQRMVEQAPSFGLSLPDRELACAPIDSDLGQAWLGAMRAAINCALANRQILTARVREVFARHLPAARLSVLHDVSHNTCKVERHLVGGRERELHVHRKGATRAFGPGHPELPLALRETGQPVLIGGSMGTGSYILAGTASPQADAVDSAFQSACHGAGRAVSRHQALRSFSGRAVLDELAARGIFVRTRSQRGVAEEAPAAYKDVAAVVDAAQAAGLARKVARLQPLICVKG